MREGYDHSPVNPLPWAVWVLALPIIAFEAVFALGQAGLAGGPEAVGWRMDALQRFAFAPGILRAMIAAGDYPQSHVTRILTYPFVHGSFTQALFVLVFLLALGKMVGEIFRPLAVIVLFLASAVGGALIYTALGVSDRPIYGGYPAVYGLIGAYTWLLWMRAAGVGESRLRAFQLIGFLLGLQLVFGLLFGGSWDWVAELSGFGVGFLLSFLLGPGGWSRALDRMRRR
ncbi:rhomboid family intramembrane serine protease [Phaeovulum vinaykumarii]|uniref:Membrane associated serine protease, rhomboid family n=1 Tax=Phaeovulum vinaykumarii TaxID=407234 RepID=A0A1N7L2R8_9RHOB|nr:rhomboid family intramembrane serine protease [Phaeovulum vinaykumarii]SIS68155.1 Membrane associated serine protease, rhomboid family [Phaeovulum vinaykumarii]SOC00260.1 membrane associated rhomboid family serine protease [Phaeovulum vinaykumarii]